MIHYKKQCLSYTLAVHIKEPLGYFILDTMSRMQTQLDEIQRDLRELRDLRGAGGPDRGGRNRENRHVPYEQNTPRENLARVLADAATAAFENPLTTMAIVAAVSHATGMSPARVLCNIAWTFLPTLPIPSMPVMPRTWFW